MIYEIFKTDQGVWAEMIGRLLDRCADKVPVVRLIFMLLLPIIGNIYSGKGSCNNWSTSDSRPLVR